MSAVVDLEGKGTPAPPLSPLGPTYATVNVLVKLVIESIKLRLNECVC